MNTTSLPEKLILASSSKYRKKLLERLGISFSCISPKIDETQKTTESPENLVERLAIQKAKVVADQHPDASVIGSDQVAVFMGQVIGKPGSHEKAFAQLTQFSGKTVSFLTAVSIQCVQTSFLEHHTDHTRVSFRALSSGEIERYLEKEKPYDCAGAFKAEALGIVLFDKIASDDPTAITGLPMIRTSAMLRCAGFQLP